MIRRHIYIINVVGKTKIILLHPLPAQHNNDQILNISQVGTIRWKISNDILAVLGMPILLVWQKLVFYKS